MNVVGRVGSLITQGVYSVATPFHPFGGAVDVIVVRQQDGTFRSTPWYVRFGKFQGVLKGAEKIVRISVNGVEANFHMYLDNSGEAYFIKEVDVGVGNENGVSGESENPDFSSINGDKHHNDNEHAVDVRRFDHSVSDSAVVQLQECESFGKEGIERAESDGDRRFYEFQDEQSSLDGSVELSEYGSTRYENLDGENIVESQNLDSEVVLVSVDGHILTAPITELEQNMENVQLSTPQFHLGPGEGTEFCDGKNELSSEENPWAADYISKLNSSTANDASDNASGVNDDESAIRHQLQVCEGEEEHDYQVPEIHNIVMTEENVQMHGDSEDVAEVEREEVFKNSSDNQVSETQDIAMTGGNVQVHNDSEDVSEVKREEVFENSSDNQVTETQNIAMTEWNVQVHGESGDVAEIKKVEVFKNSSELSELSSHVEDTQFKDLGSSEILEDEAEVEKEEVFENSSELSVIPRQVEDTPFKDLGSSFEVQSSVEAHQTVNVDDGTGDAGAVFRNIDGSSPSCSPVSVNNGTSVDVHHEGRLVHKNADGAEDIHVDDQEGRSLRSVSENSEWKDEQSDTSTAVGINGTPDRPMGEDESTSNEQMHASTKTSVEVLQAHSNISFEISLCGNKLQAGMGLDAAAKVFDAHRISAEEFKSSASSIIKNGSLIVRFRGKYLPWEKAAHIALGMAAFGLDLPIEPKDLIPVERDDTSKPKNDDSGLTPTSSGRRWRLWPNPFRRVKTLDHTDSNLSNEEEFVDSESVLPNSQVESPTSESRNESPRKQFVRTNVPTNEQIASLNLKDGQNFITFSFSTLVLGKQQVDAHIYLWKWNARIVISDVDGTITKSDVLGQFMPLVGKDWSQSGVAKLFSAIKENGYQLLFLSARAIVQAYLTRSFLLNLKQDGNTLPNGPVVISPDGLFPSLYREVIRRAPHEFKIACLEDIKRLFPSDYNPFYAGFGNRDTDELSYRKIGIPKGKIFIINPKGEVAISHRIDVRSYTSLHTLVNDMFPPTSLVEQEDFNSWNFWKMPLPDIDL